MKTWTKETLQTAQVSFCGGICLFMIAAITRLVVELIRMGWRFGDWIANGAPL